MLTVVESVKKVLSRSRTKAADLDTIHARAQRLRRRRFSRAALQRRLSEMTRARNTFRRVEPGVYGLRGVKKA